MRIALACLCLLSMPAMAQWPPSPQTVERMKALQQTLRDPQVSSAQREAAREELSGLLKSPAGQARGRTPDEKPARAAINDPTPTPVIRPTEITMMKPPPAEGVAKLEVVSPPRPVLIPETGIVLTPGRAVTVDPRTGGVLHEVPGGYIDPRTGQLVPR